MRGDAAAGERRRLHAVARMRELARERVHARLQTIASLVRKGQTVTAMAPFSAAVASRFRMRSFGNNVSDSHEALLSRLCVKSTAPMHTTILMSPNSK
jgi:hypothetical protein